MEVCGFTTDFRKKDKNITLDFGAGNYVSFFAEELGPRLGLEAKKKGIPIEVSKRILKTTIQYCGEDP
ncbi:hypothetical protein Avbf_04409 [Armadillidium vulgare]|nr:hypothetical protein Avbf_04409 [Armadillidium vulgare]